MEHNNITIDQVANLFGTNTTYLNISYNLTEQLFDFYEAYLSKEKENLVIYKFVAYVIGTLIILSNIIVVISSGLIIRKGLCSSFYLYLQRKKIFLNITCMVKE